MPLNYHHLRYFWAVAHDGNLTRTAERLNLSQSALSAQIKQLEQRLGQPLFERRGRALHLTEVGRITLDHADTIFATGQQLIATLQQTGQRRQALRIGAQATLSRNFQIGFLRPVLGRADIEVILRSGSPAELLDGLATLNLDVALMTREAASDALTQYITHRLAEQRVGLDLVEVTDPRIERIASRFMSDEESQHWPNHKAHIWGAKEAMFKSFGPSLEFRTDLAIQNIEERTPDWAAMEGTVRGLPWRGVWTHLTDTLILVVQANP